MAAVGLPVRFRVTVTCPNVRPACSRVSRRRPATGRGRCRRLCRPAPCARSMRVLRRRRRATRGRRSRRSPSRTRTRPATATALPMVWSRSKDVSGTTVGVTIANTLTRNVGSLVLAKAMTSGSEPYSGTSPDQLRLRCGRIRLLQAGGCRAVFHRHRNPYWNDLCRYGNAAGRSQGIHFGTSMFTNTVGETTSVGGTDPPSGHGRCDGDGDDEQQPELADVGSLKVTKSLTGGSFAGCFEFTYMCTLDEEDPSPAHWCGRWRVITDRERDGIPRATSAR